MPQQGQELREADGVTAIMPPSEVRPVGLGRFADPEAGGEGHSFFLRESDV